jgi:hypothetical protein
MEGGGRCVLSADAKELVVKYRWLKERMKSTG